MAWIPPHLRNTREKAEVISAPQAASPELKTACPVLKPIAAVFEFKTSPLKSQASSEISIVVLSTSAPSELQIEPASKDLKSAATQDFDSLYDKAKATASSAPSSTAAQHSSHHSRSAFIQSLSIHSDSPSKSTFCMGRSDPTHSSVNLAVSAVGSDQSQASARATSSASVRDLAQVAIKVASNIGRGIATSFSEWNANAQASALKKLGTSAQPKQAIAFATSAKPSVPFHIGSSVDSQRADKQPTTAHSTPLGLTAGTIVSRSTFEVTSMPPTTSNTLLPARITPGGSAATPVKLAPSIAELKYFRPAPTPALTPPHAQLQVIAKKMPEGRRNGWPTKAEVKLMKAKPLNDCVIDEDAFEGQAQNNDWPSDENSPELCLRQWDGDWLPAPVDWIGRHPYRKTETFAADIATWADRTDSHYIHYRDGTSSLVVDVNSETFKTGDGENVPRSWIPEKLEGVSLQQFWHSLQQSRLQPVDEEDMDWTPYWLRHSITDVIAEVANDFQTALPVPDAHLNPADPERGMYLKGKKETAMDTINRITSKAKRDQKRKEERQQKQIKEQKKQAQQPVIAPPPNPHKPAANIYLRPAVHRDFDQMVHIYNYHVSTYYSNAMTPMTRAEMEAKKRDVAAADMHMIVAVQKIKQNQPAGQRTNLQSTQEKIVGFAFTDDHEGRNALFRYAIDLEVYVHPEYLRKGIGKSLVDRMMFLADPCYESRNAVDWRPMSDDLHLIKPGSKRRLGTVQINVFYPTGEEARLTWFDRWLEQFQFKRCGLIEGGIKLHKHVNQAIFVHKNFLEIDPISAYA